MEFRLSRNVLLRGLYLAQGVADRRATMPILSHVLLRSDGKQKVIGGATDLNVSLVAEMDAQVKKEGGVAVATKALHDVVKELEGDEVHLRRLDNQWIELRAGNAEFKLAALADRDFPKLPDPREVQYSEIAAETLDEVIARTLPAASPDETRPHLNGALLEAAAGRIRLVTTDGHRLARIDREWKGGPTIHPGVLVPRKGLIEMRRVIESAEGTCQLGVHQGSLFLRAGTVALAVKLVDAQFPPYEQVIPKENDKKVTVDRLRILGVLRRVSTVTADRSHGVRVELAKRSLQVSSDEPDKAAARESLEVGYDGSGMTIGFNARYLCELLEQMTSEQITLELGGELDPVLVRPAAADDFLAVIMPMRI